MRAMVKACIGLGSNLGNRRENILRAWSRLSQNNDIKALALSSPYVSKPVGMESTNWFINATAAVMTAMQPKELLAEMLLVEADQGRKRSLSSGPSDRTIDLDLLYWDNMICDRPDLILPHPEMAKRLFVLMPLAEIEPDLSHPVSKKSSVEMLQELMAGYSADETESMIQKTSWTTDPI